MAQFIIGDKSIEKDWDAYVKGFDGLNLPQYVHFINRQSGKSKSDDPAGSHESGKRPCCGYTGIVSWS